MFGIDIKRQMATEVATNSADHSGAVSGPRLTLVVTLTKNRAKVTRCHKRMSDPIMQ